jgi:hypothetical protein
MYREIAKGLENKLTRQSLQIRTFTLGSAKKQAAAAALGF